MELILCLSPVAHIHCYVVSPLCYKYCHQTKEKIPYTGWYIGIWFDLPFLCFQTQDSPNQAHIKILYFFFDSGIFTFPHDMAPIGRLSNCSPFDQCTGTPKDLAERETKKLQPLHSTQRRGERKKSFIARGTECKTGGPAMHMPFTQSMTAFSLSGNVTAAPDTRPRPRVCVITCKSNEGCLDSDSCNWFHQFV